MRTQAARAKILPQSSAMSGRYRAARRLRHGKGKA